MRRFITRLFGSFSTPKPVGSRRRSVSDRQFRPGVEALEGRELLASFFDITYRIDFARTTDLTPRQSHVMAYDSNLTPRQSDVMAYDSFSHYGPMLQR
jgi:hypothetical protein